MEPIITLTCQDITAKIAQKGAELQSLRCRDTEYLWQGDPEFWTGRAPLLFPICGGLREDKYLLDGREYSLPKHGFARHRTFAVEAQTADSATFILKSDEQSRAVFPFDFELRVDYRLTGKSLAVDYRVTNLSGKTMYFSVGAHEAYACPEGIAEYEIVFPREETLNTCVLSGNLLEHKTVPILQSSRVLPLKEEYFAVDALVFKDVRSRSVLLKNRNSGRGVRVDFDGFDYFLLWTKPQAPYLCIEPWCGIPDPVDSNFELRDKEGIQSLAAGGTFTRRHTVTILEG